MSFTLILFELSSCMSLHISCTCSCHAMVSVHFAGFSMLLFPVKLLCDIPWYIYGFPAGITLSLVSVMHLWATLGCVVFSCHSNLVNHVRGSMSAPSRKSVTHRPLCA